MTAVQLPPELLDLVAMKNEDLHEDLVPWVEEGPLGPALKHPLVYQVLALNNGLANRIYADKLEALERCERESDGYNYVFLHERPYRLNAFVKAMTMDLFDDPWPTLGTVWIDSENIWENGDVWRMLLTAHPDGPRSMMDDRDRAAYDALPDVITVYRGASRGQNESGLSWTLDRFRAEWFATRLGASDPVLIRGSVTKEYVIAHFLGRGEDEIVVLPEDVHIEEVRDV